MNQTELFMVIFPIAYITMVASMILTAIYAIWAMITGK